MERFFWLVSSAAPGGVRVLIISVLNYVAISSYDEFVYVLNLSNFFATLIGVGFGFVAVKMAANEGVDRSITSMYWLAIFTPSLALGGLLWQGLNLSVEYSLSILAISSHIFFRNVLVGLKSPVIITCVEVLFFIVFLVMLYFDVLHQFFVSISAVYIILFGWLVCLRRTGSTVLPSEIKSGLSVGLSNVVTSGLIFLMPICLSEVYGGDKIKEISLIFSLSAIAMLLPRSYLTSKMSNISVMDVKNISSFQELNVKIIVATYLISLCTIFSVSTYFESYDFLVLSLITIAFLCLGQLSSVYLSFLSFNGKSSKVLYVNVMLFLLASAASGTLYFMNVSFKDYIVLTFSFAYLMRHLWAITEINYVRSSSQF